MANLVKVEVNVPDIGDFKDILVIAIPVKVGDVVEADDALATLESDKATMDVPSPVSGRIVELCVGLGDKISGGVLVAKIETDAAEVARADHAAREHQAARAAREAQAAKEKEDDEARKKQSARECTIHIYSLEGKLLLSVASPTANLTGADLSVAMLRNADLRNMYMLDTILRGANLEGADLQGAHLAGANLQSANLQGANLQGANLYGADLRGADLREADLSFSTLRDAKLNDAKLSVTTDGDRMSYYMMHGADTEGANFCDAMRIQR